MGDYILACITMHSVINKVPRLPADTWRLDGRNLRWQNGRLQLVHGSGHVDQRVRYWMDGVNIEPTGKAKFSHATMVRDLTDHPPWWCLGSLTARPAGESHVRYLRRYLRAFRDRPTLLCRESGAPGTHLDAAIAERLDRLYPVEEAEKRRHTLGQA